MNTNNITPEQQEDINKRVAEFLERSRVASKELQVDIIGFPQFRPLPTGGFETAVIVTPIDTKYAPVPSPFKEEPKEGPAPEAK